MRMVTNIPCRVAFSYMLPAEPNFYGSISYKILKYNPSVASCLADERSERAIQLGSVVMM